jgi:diguanylate cyclase (GGDEF)-like protein
VPCGLTARACTAHRELMVTTTTQPLTGHTWKVFLGIGAISTLTYFLIGEPKAQMLLYQATGIVSVGAVLVGVRRNRPASVHPWILLALGISAWVIGDAIWNSYELVLHRVAPWPSTADFIYLVGPVLMAFGLTGMLRRRGAPRDIEGVLDALIIAAGAGAVSWAFFMAPYAADTSLNGVTQAVAVAYPLTDVLLLAVIVRLLLAPGSHTASHRLLAAAVACTLVGDVVYSVQSLHGTYYTGHIVDISWLAFYWLIAAAAMHPSMAKPTQTVEGGGQRLRRSRLVMLAIAASLGPLTLVIQWLRDAPLDIPVIAGESIFLFLVVLVRMERLVVSVANKVDQLKTQSSLLQGSLEQREKLEVQLRHQASHDPLTDLANLNLFNDRLDHAIRRIARTGEAVGVLFLDVDDFKVVNDTLGHDAGDQVLVALGQRMRSVLRGSDVAARIGGDEFAILLEAMTAPTDAVTAAKRLLTALDAPFQVDGKAITVHASVGAASTEDQTANSQELLRQADTAMYAAKSAGKHRSVVYEPSMQDQLFGELRLLAQIQTGIERKEFRAFYQPIVDLPGGELRGAEALIRWQHPDRGLLAPAHFLASAEQAGTIYGLDVWMMGEACREAAAWKERLGDRPFEVSINVSAGSLQRAEIVDDVASALSSSGIDPGVIVLEITESVLVRDIEHTIGTLEALKRLGVGIAIDDFGTGYSSLEHLRRFPVDVLKIDKAFVDGVARGSEGSSFAEAIITLADQLHLRTIAEGVETDEQAQTLASLGARAAQGYVFSKPVPVDRMHEFVSRAARGDDWRTGRPLPPTVVEPPVLLPA